jgi:nitrile hydratase accessory protein
MTTSIPPSAPLAALPRLPRDAQGPVFQAPWEAQAFAMAVKLHERGVYAWSEWAAALAEELAAAAARGEPDDGTHYYEHWLAALEKLVHRKQVVTHEELDRRADEWDAAARATPHGQPIVLGSEKKKT